jgi:hypothetical protein
MAAALWLQAGLLVCITAHACDQFLELVIMVSGPQHIGRLQDVGVTEAQTFWLLTRILLYLSVEEELLHN